ncbi:MAG: C-terminal binding protein [Paeniglutamicibacter sp.]
MPATPRVLITDAADLDHTIALDLLAEAGIEATYLDSRDRGEILAAARQCAGIILGYASLDASMIAALPNLKVIATMSAGFDMVDVQAATHAGITVCTVPSAATADVATHAFAGILALVRQLPRSQALARAGDWTGTGLPVPPRFESLTLGLVGFGRIAQFLANIAEPVFKEVIAYDPFTPAECWPDGVRRVELDELLESSSVLSLHTPLTGETENLIDARALEAMPAGSYLVNVARGGLVDESALLEALDSGHLAGAMLDVLAQEPAPANHPLLSHPSAIITPHTAYRSTASLREYMALPARNVIAVVAGRAAETPLLIPVSSR